MIGIGWWYSKGIRNTEDYFLSGRRFGTFAIACTLTASMIGGGLFMGMLGFLVRYGIVTVAIVVGTAISFVILGLFFGPRLRRLNVTTLPQFIGRRFDPKNRLLIVATSLFILLGGTAIQFKASGAILATVFHIPYFWAVLFSAVVITFYTTLGGFRSVVVTDIVQMLIIFVGVLLAFPIVLKLAGGPEEVIATVSELQGGQFFNFLSHGVAFLIGAFIILTILPLTSPENHQRLYATRDPKTAKHAGIFAGFFFFVILALVFLIGMVGLTFYPNLENPDNFFPKLAVEMLPVWLGGILLAAIAAAIMSSADTGLLAASSIVITDIYQKYKRKALSEKKLVRISKMSVVAIAGIGFVIALAFPTVVSLMLFFNSLLASIALAPIVFGLFWKRASSLGAFCGGLAGGAVDIALFSRGMDPASSALLSVAISCIVLVILSLIKNRSYSRV